MPHRPPRSQHPGLDLLIQRLLLASRRRSWRGRIWCNRCWSCGEADGAYAAFSDGRICRITRGGLPVRLAQELDLLTQVQCGECAVALHGRGNIIPRAIEGSRSMRSLLLHNGGALVQMLRRALNMRIVVPHEAGLEITAHGTSEQHWRLQDALTTASTARQTTSGMQVRRLPSCMLCRCA